MLNIKNHKKSEIIRHSQSPHYEKHHERKDSIYAKILKSFSIKTPTYILIKRLWPFCKSQFNFLITVNAFLLLQPTKVNFTLN